jgi:hypothetical protein
MPPPVHETGESRMRKIVASLAITLVILVFLPQSPALALPDLVVQSVNAPSWAAQGSTISVTVIFKNQGTDLTHCCYVACRMIVSQDQDINLDDLYYPADKNIDNSLLEANESAPLNFTYTLPPNLSGPYYVGAYVDTGFWHTESNEGNNANYDPTPMFIGQPDPPDLVSPSNGSAMTVGQDITFSWSTSPGAARYRLKVCTDQSMANQISGSPFEPGLGQTSQLVASSHFAAGQTYYWQVGAIAAGDVGGWGDYGPSPPWSISVDRPQPPDLSSPANGSTIAVGQDITFSWGSSQGAGRYRLKICTNSSMTSNIPGSPFDNIPSGQRNYTVPASSFTAGQTYN